MSSSSCRDQSKDNWHLVIPADKARQARKAVAERAGTSKHLEVLVKGLEHRMPGTPGTESRLFYFDPKLFADAMPNAYRTIFASEGKQLRTQIVFDDTSADLFADIARFIHGEPCRWRADYTHHIAGFNRKWPVCGLQAHLDRVCECIVGLPEGGKQEGGVHEAVRVAVWTMACLDVKPLTPEGKSMWGSDVPEEDMPQILKQMTLAERNKRMQACCDAMRSCFDKWADDRMALQMEPEEVVGIFATAGKPVPARNREPVAAWIDKWVNYHGTPFQYQSDHEIPEAEDGFMVYDNRSGPAEHISKHFVVA